MYVICKITKKLRSQIIRHFANVNKFNLYPGACLALSDVFVYTTVTTRSPKV